MKKVTVLLPLVQPMAFLAEPHEVVNLRELVRLGEGIFTKDDVNISAAHVMAFSVEDFVEETKEDGCNT